MPSQDRSESIALPDIMGSHRNNKLSFNNEWQMVRVEVAKETGLIFSSLQVGVRGGGLGDAHLKFNSST